MRSKFTRIVLAAAAFAAPAIAQDRDTLVQRDKTAIESDGRWIYNDVDAGFREAKASGKPLLLVFR